MPNLAISSDASFEKIAHQWTVSDLPITLNWRNTSWRYIVPTLWIFGVVFWMWVVSVDTPQRGAALYAVFFVAMPLILALSAGWWVVQLVNRRISGTVVINDDYLEWQYPADSDVDLLTDCSRFELAGKRNHEARIEWDIATSGVEAAGGWPEWAKRWRLLDWIKSDRVLYGRDVGLDRSDLESLCRLLNQLRDEATARS